MPYGPLGIGKSSFACKVTGEVYGTPKQPNWEAVKTHIVFHPKDFVTKTEEMMQKGQKDKVLIWDDAGLWLLALEHWHPFVRSTIKYLNVARTNWAALIFTTPLPSWVIKKVRGFPEAITIKIMKASSDTSNPSRQRIGKAYRFWTSPDMKRSGVMEIYREKFTAIMPNDFYWLFYKPLRDTYAAQAIAGMRRELSTLLGKTE